MAYNHSLRSASTGSKMYSKNLPASAYRQLFRQREIKQAVSLLAEICGGLRHNRNLRLSFYNRTTRRSAFAYCILLSIFTQ